MCGSPLFMAVVSFQGGLLGLQGLCFGSVLEGPRASFFALGAILVKRAEGVFYCNNTNNESH